MPNLGLLHSSVTGEYSKHECMPCTVDELTSCSYDAWLLGHVHGRAVLSGDSFIGWVGMGKALIVSLDDGTVTVRDL